MKPEIKPLYPVQRDPSSRVHLVVTEGRKWVTCVMLDYPIRLVQLPLDAHGLTTLMLRTPKGSEQYPLKRALRLFRQFAKEHGITDGAKAALESLKDEA